MRKILRPVIVVAVLIALLWLFVPASVYTGTALLLVSALVWIAIAVLRGSPKT